MKYIEMYLTCRGRKREIGRETRCKGQGGRQTQWTGRELIRLQKLGKGAVVHANLVVELEGGERKEEAMTISINHRAATTRSRSL